MLGFELMPLADAPPGRMSPLTALSFLAAGTALLALVRRKDPWEAALSAALASVPAALGAVTAMSYLTGVQSAVAIGRGSGMAVHTAAGFLRAS